MDLSQPHTQTYPAELLTQWFQVTGEITPLGDILSFVNDPQRGTLTIEQATATPLQACWRVGVVSVPNMVVPKSEVQILLVGDLTLEDLRLLPRTVRLVVYTDTYAVMGHFHTGTETKASDIFHISQGPFFPASEAEVYAVQPLSIALGGGAPVVFANKEHVSLYYEQG